jgi:hypothetical protein
MITNIYCQRECLFLVISTRNMDLRGSHYFNKEEEMIICQDQVKKPTVINLRPIVI